MPLHGEFGNILFVLESPFFQSLREPERNDLLYSDGDTPVPLSQILQ